MSYLKPNTAGVYDIQSANIDTLYVKGKKFQDYISELVVEDQLEQSEITEIKLLLEYLDTTGLNSAWTVTNSNVNETLRASITALQTKLANIDTTALTETSVLNNDNRNSVLKTRLDTAATDLTALTTRVTTAETDIDNLETRVTTAETDIDNLETRMTTAEGDIDSLETRMTSDETNISNLQTRMTTAEGDIDAVEFKTKYIEVNEGDPNDDETSHTVAIGNTMHSAPNTASHKYAYLGLGILGQGFVAEYKPDEISRVRVANTFGDVQIEGTHADIRSSNINIGWVNSGILGMGETINIGGTMSRVNIGSEEDPRIGLGVPIPDSDFNNSTIITIGKRTNLKNTWTHLRGNIYTSESRWEDLAVTDVVTIETAAAWFSGFVFSGGLPYWLLWVGLSGVPNYRYSDIVKMANNYQTGGLTKNHSIETSNDISVKNIRVMDFTVVSLETAFDAILARLVFQAFAVHGSHSIGSIWGRTNIYAGSGEIELRVDGGAFDFAFKNAGNSNRVLLDNDNVEVCQCNGSGGTGRLRLVAANGNIELSTAQGGVRSYARKIMELTYQKQVIIGDDSTMEDATYKMLVDATSHTNGIKVAKGSDTLLLNPTNVNTKSVTFQSGYTGTTDNTLYMNGDGKLVWNGMVLSTSIGGGGGGLEYYIPLAINITDPAPIPSTQFATETYTSAPQRTITQSTTAVATGILMAKYATGIINKESNPFVEGLQTIQQHLTWSENNTVGQIYGQTWFQAYTDEAGTFIYDRSFTGVTITNGFQVLNGVPILAPQGLFYLNCHQVIFPGIKVDTFNGLSITMQCRLEALITENWTTLQTSNSSITYWLDNENETITFNETFTHNQTSKTNAPTAYRMVLFLTTPPENGQIHQQTFAGSAGNDLIAYKLGTTSGNIAAIRVLLYDGVNAKQTITHTSTPSLVAIELPISPPYQIGAFNFGRLAFDMYMFQPSGAVNANHQMTFYFGDGTISHIESTINEPPEPTPTLAQVLNSGATASQPINMNSNKISGITTLEGAANGNWNVKEITAGSGVSVTPTNGNYAIANTGILSINPGTGISVSTTNGVATITNTGVGPTQVSVSQNIRDEHQSLYEVGALPRKPDYWATNWSVADTAVRSHRDIYVSVDGKIIASATGLGNAGIRYSTNYGTTFAEGNVFFTNLEWTSICGTSNGSKLFAFGRDGSFATGFVLLLYTSVNQGATWTPITSSVFAFQNAAGITTVNRVRCSGDGTYILANISNVGTQGRSLFSSDGGATWVVKNISSALGSGFTNGVAMSRSGAVQFITWINDTGDNSKVFRSIDYGATWTEVFGHLSGGKWSNIETDATGRYVWATRFDTINNPELAVWYSDNYGSSWVQAVGFNSIEEIWISGTGQFVVGVTVPNPYISGNRYLTISRDYGRSVSYHNLGNTTTFRVVNGSADGSVLVLGSSNETEGSNPSYTGDGLIRIAQSGVENIYDMLQAHNVLWYSTNIKSSSAVSSVSFPINATYGDINFDTHNIEYEIEINWDRQTYTSPASHLLMGFNGIYNELNIHSSNTTWLLMIEHATAPLNNGSQGSNGYTQHYNNRFYCGYSATQGFNDILRYKTLLTGKLGVQKRRQAQTADLGTFAADWSLDARTLTNRFTSDNYLLQSSSFNISGPDRSILFTQNDFDNGHHCVTGTAIWELTDSGAWETGYGGSLTALKDGIKNINISFVNNSNGVGFTRAFDVSARFWRVRK